METASKQVPSFLLPHTEFLGKTSKVAGTGKYLEKIFAR